MKNTAGLEFAAKTDTGLVRSQNEDAIALSQEFGFAVLADGMGGYNAGEVASGIATVVTTQVLEEGLRLPQEQEEQAGSTIDQGESIPHLMAEAIRQANAAILAAGHAEPQYQGMGTTLVAAVFAHDKIVVAHVGDSRAYRFRRGELVQITRDHSLLQEQIDAGLVDPAWAHYAQNKNLVTRAVGVVSEIEVEVHEHQTEPQDIYLLCSDGMSDMLHPFETSEILTRYQSSLETACSKLIDKANDNGGHDNISVILIRVGAAGEKTGGLLGRFLNWAI